MDVRPELLEAYETSTGGAAEVGDQSFIPQVQGPVFYASTNELVFTPFEFVHDTTVNIVLQKGSGYTAERNGLSISSLGSGNGIQFGCEYDEAPYSMTLTVTGAQTGQVATWTVSGIACYLE